MSSYRIKPKQVNEFVVKPIRLAGGGPRPSPVPHLFKINYPNIGIIAQKQTGKTTVISNIIREITRANKAAGVPTVVIFFVDTLFTDPTYKEIVKRLHRAKIPYILERSLKDADGNDQLLELMDYLKACNPEDDEWARLIGDEGEREGDSEESFSETEIDSEPEVSVGSPVPFDTNDWDIIIVIDDLSQEIRNSSTIPVLVKANRHTHATVILSSQDVIDFPLQCLSQMQYMLAFSKIPQDPKNNRLARLYSSLSLNIPYDIFRALYEEATSSDRPGAKSRNFLFIDQDRGKFRKNFNIGYSIREQ